MSVVVADAGPVNYLVLLGHEETLPQLFGNILVPDAVFAEIINEGAPNKVKEFAYSAPNWLKLKSPSNVVSLALDPGETEAIALALEVRADAILLDDRQARMVAEDFGLVVSGTVGILESAAARGLLELAPTLHRLTHETNFRATPQLIARAIERDAARRSGGK